MTPSELHTLIQSDQQAAAMAAVGNDSGCAARCSVIAPPVRQRVATSALRLTLARRGKLGPILKIAANVNSSDPPYSTCLLLVTLLDAESTINIDDAATQAAATDLVTHNLLTTEDVTAINALADTPQVISADEVSAAMAPHRGLA